MQPINFSKDQLSMLITSELKLDKKIKVSLPYIVEQLKKTGNSITLDSLDNIDLNKSKRVEGKNYDWFVVEYENLTFVIRKYRLHFTIYCLKLVDSEIMGKNNKISAFIVHTKSSKFNLSDSEHDKLMEEYYDNPFLDLNVLMKGIVEHYQKNNFHFLSNPSSLPRPKHVEISNIFECDEYFSDMRIVSFDKLVFCVEELDTIHHTLFAENTMLDKLKDMSKTFVVGQKFDSQHNIKEICTDLKDDYYNDVGILLEESSTGKPNFTDVYSLTRWYYDSIFNDEPIK